MASDLRIGTAGSKPFTLPAEIATQTMAIVGIRGSGKTVTATDIAEELLKRGHQVVIIDPTDVWWGLKSSADGEAPGFPVVILGGSHGDLPLAAENGAVLADFAVEERVPLILSLRHLRKEAQRRFVTDFAEQLYHRKGEPQHRTALTVFIDEASQFAPQRVMGDTARMVGAMQDLVRLGRSSGLGVAVIDQRPASINKDLLTQLEVLICHRITSPQDRKALDEWVRQNDTAGHRDDFLSGLASLPEGTAWFWSPLADLFARVKVRMRETFDSSRTPKPGEAAAVPGKVAKVDLDALRARLQETIQEAESSDPKRLRARIQELERTLRSGGQPADSDAIARARQEGRDACAADFRRALQPVVERMLRSGSQLAEIIRRAADHAEAIGLELEAFAGQWGSGSSPAPDPVDAERATPTRTKSSPAARATGGAGEDAPVQRILDALATYEGMGPAAAERPAVAAVAGYKQGGYFNVAVSRAVNEGLITTPAPGQLALTDAGRARARSRDFRSLADVHAAWMEMADEPQRKILHQLIKAHPHPLRRDELADRCGFKLGGYFNVALKRLATMGAAEFTPGHARASDLLFPPGLRT